MIKDLKEFIEYLKNPKGDFKIFMDFFDKMGIGYGRWWVNEGDYFYKKHAGKEVYIGLSVCGTDFLFDRKSRFVGNLSDGTLSFQKRNK